MNSSDMANTWVERYCEIALLPITELESLKKIITATYLEALSEGIKIGKLESDELPLYGLDKEDKLFIIKPQPFVDKLPSYGLNEESDRVIVRDRNDVEIKAGQRVLVHQDEGTRKAIVIKPFPDNPTVNEQGYWVDINIDSLGTFGMPSNLLEVINNG